MTRAEPRQRVMEYLLGTSRITERKNGWQARRTDRKERQTGFNPYSTPRDFDVDQVRGDLRHYIMTHLADPEAVLLDRELYLHADWEKDPGAERQAGVPKARRKKIPKPIFAKQMLARDTCLWSESRPGDG